MANKQLSLSKEGKDLLDSFVPEFELERPLLMKIAFAKGFSSEKNIAVDTSSSPKWSIPEGIIKNETYLLFKHLLINEKGSLMSEEEINKQLLYYIEKGLRIIQQTVNDKNSLDDSKLLLMFN